MIATRTALHTRLFLAFALVTLVALGLPPLFTRDSLFQERIDLATRQALAQASVLKSVLDANPTQAHIAALLASVKASGARMTVADKKGTVVHDSHVDDASVEQMDNHSDRPEIEAARSGGQGVSLRHSSTLDIDTAYAAVLLRDGGTLRLGVPVAGIRQGLEKQLSALSLTLAGTALVCLLLSVFITRRVRGGIDEMAEVVAGIARNRGGKRLLKVPGKEFLPLAYAINNMAENIEQYIRTSNDQHTQLEVILESIREGILVLGPGGSIRRCNMAMTTMFPAVTRCMGKQLIEAIPVPALQRRVEDLLAGGRDGGEQEDDPLHIEHDGRFLVAHISRPVEKNQSLGAVIILYDATHIMRLERVRRDFVANVSHELRTPLTAISGYAETLMGLEALDPVHRNFAAIIHRQAQALGRVIGDMLALARVEDTKESIQRSRVDPEQPLHEALRLCAAQAEQKGLRVSIDLPHDVPVMANATLLAQVFRNLFENAFRYSPEGGEVAVSGRVEDGQMRFCVKDRGPGIPKEELSRIFERLYQVKKQRNSGSSGIGLAISKHIIERHGGTIWAESPCRDFATAMVFTLPLATTPSKDSQ